MCESCSPPQGMQPDERRDHGGCGAVVHWRLAGATRPVVVVRSPSTSGSRLAQSTAIASARKQDASGVSTCEL